MNICLYLSLSEKIQNEFEIVHPILVYKVNKDVCYTIIPKNSLLITTLISTMSANKLLTKAVCPFPLLDMQNYN